MVATPAETAETVPNTFTDAIEGLDEDHTPPVTAFDNPKLLPGQIARAPEIVPAVVGATSTEIVSSADAVPQLLVNE
jgi:hypothetical protein